MTKKRLALARELGSREEAKEAARREEARLAAEKEKRCSGQATMAYVMSQEFLKRQLKAPSTAEFPSMAWDPQNVRVSATDDCSYRMDAVSYAAGFSPRSVAVADLDGDTVPDVVTANGSSDKVSVLLGNGNGTFQAASSFSIIAGEKLEKARTPWRSPTLTATAFLTSPPATEIPTM